MRDCVEVRVYYSGICIVEFRFLLGFVVYGVGSSRVWYLVFILNFSIFLFFFCIGEGEGILDLMLCSIGRLYLSFIDFFLLGV